MKTTAKPVAKQPVEMIAGEILLESQIGEDSTFTAVLSIEHH
jgi:hypothetical protein